MAKRGRCCCGCNPLTLLLVPLISLVVFVGLIFGGIFFAYNTYAKPYTGLELGELYSMTKQVFSVDKEEIVTNSYDEEVDLASFYTTFKEGAYIKEDCDINFTDILNSITAQQSADGVEQNPLSNIEFDTEAIRADLAAVPEDSTFVPKTIEISDKEIAALINEILSSIVDSAVSSVSGGTGTDATEGTGGETSLAEDGATTGEGGSSTGDLSDSLADAMGGLPIDFSNFEGDILKLEQVIINSEAAYSKDATLTLTISIPIRAIAVSGLSLGQAVAEGQESIGKYIDMASGILTKLLPEEVLLSMTVSPYDSEASAVVQVNNTTAETMEMVFKLFDNLREKGVLDLDVRTTMVALNQKIVDVFASMSEMVDISLVNSSFAVKPIQTVLSLLKMEDVTEQDFATTLKALLIVDGEKIVAPENRYNPEGNASEPFFVRLKAGYAIDSEFVLNKTNILEEETLTSLVDNITFEGSGFDFDKVNSEMRVAITGPELADIIGSNLSSLLSGEGEGGEGSTLDNLNLELAQMLIKKPTSADNEYQLYVTFSLDIKKMVNDMLNEESASATEGEASGTDTAAQLKETVGTLIEDLMPEAIYISAVSTFTVDSDGIITNLVIDYEHGGEPATDIALNELDVAGTQEKLNVIKKMLNAISEGGGDQFDVDSITQQIDKALREALNSIAGEEGLGTDLRFGMRGTEAVLLLPSIYEMVEGSAGLKADTTVTPDDIRLALAALVDFDDTELVKTNYDLNNADDANVFVERLKLKYAIDDSGKLDYDAATFNAETDNIADFKLTADNFTETGMADSLVDRVNLAMNGFEFDENALMKVQMYSAELASIMASKMSENMSGGITAAVKQVWIIYEGTNTTTGVATYIIRTVLCVDSAAIGAASEGEGESESGLLEKILVKDLYVTADTRFEVQTGKILNLAFDETNVRTEIVINDTAAADAPKTTEEVIGILDKITTGLGSPEAMDGIQIEQLEKTVDSAIRDALTQLTSSVPGDVYFDKNTETVGGKEVTTAYFLMPSIYEVIESKANLAEDPEVEPADIRLALISLVDFDDTTLKQVTYDLSVTPETPNATDSNVFVDRLKAKYAIDDTGKLDYDAATFNPATDKIGDFKLTADNFTVEGMADSLIDRVNLSASGYEFLENPAMKVQLYSAELASIMASEMTDSLSGDMTADVNSVEIIFNGYDAATENYTYVVRAIICVDVAAGQAENGMVAKMFEKKLYVTSDTTFIVNHEAIQNLAYDALNVRTEIVLNNATATSAQPTPKLFSVLDKITTGMGVDSAMGDMDLDKLAATIDQSMRDALVKLTESASGIDLYFSHVTETVGEREVTTAFFLMPSIYEMIESNANLVEDPEVEPADIRLALISLVDFDDTALKQVTYDLSVTPETPNATDSNVFVERLKAKYAIDDTGKLDYDAATFNPATDKIGDFKLTADNFTVEGMAESLIDRVNLSSEGYAFLDNAAMRVQLFSAELASIMASEMTDSLSSDMTADVNSVEIMYIGYDDTTENYTYVVRAVICVDVAAGQAENGMVAKMFEKKLYVTSDTTFIVNHEAIQDLAYDALNVRTEIVLNNATAASAQPTPKLFSVLGKITDGMGVDGAMGEMDLAKLAATIDKSMRDALVKLTESASGIDLCFSHSTETVGESEVTTAYFLMPSIYEMVQSSANVTDTPENVAADKYVTLDSIKTILEKLYQHADETPPDYSGKTSINTFINTLNDNYYLHNPEKQIDYDTLFGSGVDAEGFDALYNILDQDAVDFTSNTAEQKGVYYDNRNNHDLRSNMNTQALAEIMAEKFTNTSSEALESIALLDVQLYDYNPADVFDLDYSPVNRGANLNLYLSLKVKLSSANVTSISPEYMYLKVYTEFVYTDALTCTTQVVINQLKDATTDNQANMFKVLNGVSGSDMNEADITNTVKTEVEAMVDTLSSSVTGSDINVRYIYKDATDAYEIEFPSLFDYTASLMFAGAYGSYPLYDDTVSNEIGDIVRRLMQKLNTYDYDNDTVNNDYEEEYNTYVNDADIDNNRNNVLIKKGQVGVGYYEAFTLLHDVGLKLYLNGGGTFNDKFTGTGFGSPTVKQVKFLTDKATATDGDAETASAKAFWQERAGITIDGGGKQYISFALNITLQMNTATDENAALLNKLIPSSLTLFSLKEIGGNASIAIGNLDDAEQAVLFMIMNKRKTVDKVYSKDYIATLLSDYIDDALDIITTPPSFSGFGTVDEQTIVYGDYTDTTTYSPVGTVPYDVADLVGYLYMYVKLVP